MTHHQRTRRRRARRRVQVDEQLLTQALVLIAEDIARTNHTNDP